MVRDFLDNPAAALVSLDDGQHKEKEVGRASPRILVLPVRDSGTMKLKEQSLSGRIWGYAKPDVSKVAASTGCAEVAFSLRHLPRPS